MEPVHTELTCCVDRYLRNLTLPYCKAENIEILAVELVICSLDVRNLTLAWSAPWRPEVNEDIFALTYIVRELCLLVDRLRIHASCVTYNVLNCEVCEHLAGSCVDTSRDSILHTLNIAVVLEFRNEKVDERKKCLHLRALAHTAKTLKSEKRCEVVIVCLKSSLSMSLVLCHELIVESLKSSILLLVIHKGISHDSHLLLSILRTVSFFCRIECIELLLCRNLRIL